MARDEQTTWVHGTAGKTMVDIVIDGHLSYTLCKILNEYGADVRYSFLPSTTRTKITVPHTWLSTTLTGVIYVWIPSWPMTSRLHLVAPLSNIYIIRGWCRTWRPEFESIRRWNDRTVMRLAAAVTAGDTSVHILCDALYDAGAEERFVGLVRSGEYITELAHYDHIPV